MISRICGVALLCLGLTIMSGCDATRVEVVDLDKVLDAFAETLAELDGDDSSVEADAIQEVGDEEDKAENQEKFLALYAKKLNEKKVATKAVGVEFMDSGTVRGFADANGNNKADAGEKEMFTVDIDVEGKRLIASDKQYYRDRSHRPRAGFFTGYMFGRMMGRNRSYYSGSKAGMKPKWGSKTMSSKGYHTKAVSTAKAKARASSSARSRSGSKGFSFGK